MNINKPIHEAMGLCNCINHRFGDNTLPLCPKCLIAHTSIGFYPDYTEPVPYCALMDWMRKDHNNSYKFKMWLNSTKDISTIYHWFFLTRQEQITLIAEAIEAGVFK